MEWREGGGGALEERFIYFEHLSALASTLAQAASGRELNVCRERGDTERHSKPDAADLRLAHRCTLAGFLHTL